MTAFCSRAKLEGIIIALLLCWQPVLGADDFSFDASAYKKKSFEMGGFVELEMFHQILNQDTSLYFLDLQQQRPRKNLNQISGTMEVKAKYTGKKFGFNFLGHAEITDDHRSREVGGAIYEAYFSYKSSRHLTIDAGKKALRWGKGYAWNPVGFVERIKDPNDPDLGREGYELVSADYIRSYTKNLKTFAFTPVLLPVSRNTNKEYGEPDHVNVAGKFYFLYKNTDIDLLFLNEGSRSTRYGIDFSRNISTNFEIHGEWARISEIEKTITDLSGNTWIERRHANNYLLGVRYLTKNEITIIAEYYHNDAGYSVDQMDIFYQAARTAETNADTALLTTLKSIASQGYAARNPGRNYFYTRVSKKDPFDFLYWTPAVTAIVNLDDNSYSLTPEVIYTGVKNLEMRLRFSFLRGEQNSEFGEKVNDSKIEMRMRYFF